MEIKQSRLEAQPLAEAFHSEANATTPPETASAGIANLADTIEVVGVSSLRTNAPADGAAPIPESPSDSYDYVLSVGSQRDDPSLMGKEYVSEQTANSTDNASNLLAPRSSKSDLPAGAGRATGPLRAGDHDTGVTNKTETKDLVSNCFFVDAAERMNRVASVAASGYGLLRFRTSGKDANA